MINGPWDNEPNSKTWKHAGLQCEVKRHSSLGHLCGYVTVPTTHPLADSSRADRELEVHGGVAFARYSEYSDEFIIGFDCGHHNDLCPGSPGLGGEYRDFAYVTEQVNSLAEQLKKAGRFMT